MSTQESRITKIEKRDASHAATETEIPRGIWYSDDPRQVKGGYFG
jgi:hypothetical protein